MADVFISYARAERSRVVAITDALVAEGFTIWFDSHLQPGETFRDEIERELNAAKVVLVVWSAQSVQSQWVRAEAGRGMGRGVLVPVCIDRSTPPFPFSELQTPDLSDWAENRRDPAWRSVVEKIKIIIKEGPHEPIFTRDRDRKLKPHPKDTKGRIYLGKSKSDKIAPGKVHVYYDTEKSTYRGYPTAATLAMLVPLLIIWLATAIFILLTILSIFLPVNVSVISFLISYIPIFGFWVGYILYFGVEVDEEVGEQLLAARYIRDAEIDVKRLVV